MLNFFKDIIYTVFTPMHIEPWGWIAIVIICILVFTWIFIHLGKTGYLPNGVFKDTYESMIVSAHRQYDNYFEDPEHLYTRTIGYQDDDTVQLALTKAHRKEKMHERHERSGVASGKNANNAAVNAFIIGDLYHYNMAPNVKNKKQKAGILAKAAAYYGKAIQRISLMPKSVINGNKNQQHPPVEEMVNRVEDFYETYLDQLPQTDAAGIPDNDFTLLRQDVRQARLAQARENAENPITVPPTQTQRSGRVRKAKKHKPGTTQTQKVRDEYFEDRDIRSSPQNVHDTELTNEMLNIYTAITAANEQERGAAGIDNFKTASLQDIRIAIKNHKWEPLASDPNGTSRQARALRIVDLAAKGGTLSQLDYASEDQVMLNVWQRVNADSNQENKESLMSAFMSSLADGMDANWNGEYKEVCITGRCARMLGSLTLLDTDSEISAPLKTGEILRNEVFAKSYKILQDQLDKQPQKVQDAYNGKDLEISDSVQAQLDAFESDIKQEIAKTVRSDYPSSKPSVLDQLIQDAQAGV